MIEKYLLQILLVAAGLILFLRTIWLLARKKLTETISMFWGTLSILFVVAGIALIPLEWSRYLSTGALLIVAAGFLLMLTGMFYLSQQLSYTIRKTQELAIQISLLNQEHVKTDQCLSGLSGQSRNHIWRTTTVAEQSEQEDGKPHEEYSVCH